MSRDEPLSGSAALEQGRQAYDRHAWREAHEALDRADAAAPLAPDDLERLAWAAALRGYETEFLALLERLYQTHLDAGRSSRAARFAFWLGMRLISLGEAGRAGGWLARAERLCASQESECVERGYLLVPLVYRQLASGACEAAVDSAVSAAAIGERFGELDLVALAHTLEGRALLRQGRIERGLARLDEAMVAASGRELSPVVTGLVYCGAIASCHEVYAFGRAREWTLAAEEWCEREPELVTFSSVCRAHQVEMLQLSGAWTSALERAQGVAERFGLGSEVPGSADARYQEGEIHRLRGELDRAEAAYERANALGREPQPGLALLRVAQGRRDAAASALRRLLHSTTEPLSRARFLPAWVDVLLATADTAGAREASEELEGIAQSFDTEVLAALAAYAKGAVALALGNAQGAVTPLRRSFEIWHRLGAPYPAARARVEIGRACRTLGDEDGARLELGAAREVFEKLGAVPELERLGALSIADKAPAEADAKGRLTARELEVLRLVATGMTNRAIASELGLSEKTIDRHVSNILGKLAVPTRAAATAYAYANGLMI